MSQGNDILFWWPFAPVRDVQILSSKASLVLTEQGKFVVKDKDNTSQAAREKRLLELLQNKGVPVHELVHTHESGDDTVCVYSFLEGAPSSDIDAHGSQFGEEIGRMHVALHGVSCADVPTRNLYETVYEWVLQSISDSQDDKVQEVGVLLREIKPQMTVLRDLPRQIIHRDTHPGNMIFEDDQFNGFVDFDIVENNIRLFDPCYCAASALPTGLDQEGFTNRWLSFVREIFSGYESANSLTILERRSVGYVLIGIEALFTALFVKSDPAIARKNASICLWLADTCEEIQRQL